MYIKNSLPRNVTDYGISKAQATIFQLFQIPPHCSLWQLHQRTLPPGVLLSSFPGQDIFPSYANISIPVIFEEKYVIVWASLMAQRLKRLPAMQETWVQSLGQEDSPGEANGNPLQYSCLENPMNGGAWWDTVHGILQSKILACIAIPFSRGSC